MAEKAEGLYLVKLVKGPRWSPGVTAPLLALQFRHMRNLWQLRRTGKALLFGPVSDGGDLRGIVLLAASTEDQARQWISTDPAVKAGRLSCEIIRI